MIRITHRGQSLVEFALIGTLLITLLLGTVDFGLTFYTQIIISNAVGQGGYYATQNPGDPDGTKQQVIQEAARQGISITASHITVTCDQGESSSTADDATTISVTYEHPLLFTFVIPSAKMNLGDQTVVPQLGGC